MKNFQLFFINLFVVASLLSCSSDDSNNNNEPNVLDPSLTYEELNISYGTDNDQVFDLYLPANRNFETKTIILVHGGGWVSGDKSDMDLFKQVLMADLPNYAIVNMNYRLADLNNSPYPMQISDITSVVDYLKNEAQNYTISDDIGFIGTSAGAHLSMLWSYAFDTENQVNMVGSIVGPTNFTDPNYINLQVYQDVLTVFALSGQEISNAFLEKVSPFHRVTALAPPTILFYGGEDELIPSSQSMDMHVRLANLGVTHEFNFYPNEGHGWDGENLFDTMNRLKSFIETHL